MAKQPISPSQLSIMLQEHALWLDTKGQQGKRLMLSKADNLEHVNSQGVKFQKAQLLDENLLWPDLLLQGVNRGGTNFQGANLQGANLQGVNLGGADLQNADLQHANLQYANLQYAKLHDADLAGAKNVTQDQLNQALGNSATILPPHLTRPKHWLERALTQEDIIENLQQALAHGNADDSTIKQAIDIIQQKIDADEPFNFNTSQAQEALQRIKQQASDMVKMLEDAISRHTDNSILGHNGGPPLDDVQQTMIHNTYNNCTIIYNMAQQATQDTPDELAPQPSSNQATHLTLDPKPSLDQVKELQESKSFWQQYKTDISIGVGVAGLVVSILQLLLG